ncbi:MAG: Na+/H+ antiporter NhaA [Microbacterium sp. 67-17]|uniref:Na+/H+ antiporter NhaA n=1 Tax=Microbacterium sp. 67-17 TaxID=1895782 RepID=UPI00096007F2|nr:Na+/H+ antiporter NhaA [Microbacterium sp. 67-17]OJV95396.1 MAG: Na+/H+ antiporter NhaA [Microbacterium sp. 67-17]
MTGWMARFRGAPEALRGATVLLAATLVALVWANLPGDTYDMVWHLPLGFEIGDFSFELDLRHWVNDAAMALFFASVTLEVRRELELGELRDWRRASAALIAAVAGLVVPAILFIAVNGGTDAVGGWGVVISTDTAFVLGMLALVGRSMPPQLRVFLVTLAVADDVGALAVIAFAYTDDFTPAPLILVAVGLAIILAMRRAGVWRGALYLAPSVVVWAGFLMSGVHATLAGVAIALLLPVFSTRPADMRRANDHVRAFQQSPSAHAARAAEQAVARAISVNERAYRALNPSVTWFILPLFALANAGVSVAGPTLSDAFGSRLTWGVVIGLVVGNAVAITLSTLIVRRVSPHSVSPNLRIEHIFGLSLLAGMGFTISLFVAELAFTDPVDLSRAQIGILTGTLTAALLGALAFGVLGVRERRRVPDRDRLLRSARANRDPMLGDAERALVTVVEYGDFTSPFSPTSDEMRREMTTRFGTDVAFTFRHLPTVNSASRTAALANEAARAQGRFWEMRDALLREAPVESERQILRAASAAGVNLRRLQVDRDRGLGAWRVEQDASDAESMSISTAPTFFIGGVRYNGPIDADSINAAVADAVSTAGRSASLLPRPNALTRA